MEVWPTARTFGSLKLAFSDPHSLIKQSLKVHFECKLDYNFVLLRSYVVLSLTSSLVYDGNENVRWVTRKYTNLE
jgi:hypothetical protein